MVQSDLTIPSKDTMILEEKLEKYIKNVIKCYLIFKYPKKVRRYNSYKHTNEKYVHLRIHALKDYAIHANVNNLGKLKFSLYSSSLTHQGQNDNVN